MVPHEQKRGFRGRFTRTEEAREEAKLRAMARLVGESALAVRPNGELLTGAEQRILLALAQGMPVKDIATMAHVYTLRQLKRRAYTPIREKLGARNMAHAVRLGFQEGLISPESIDLSLARNLSPARKEVLELISYGATNHDICQIMGIATRTATTHKVQIKKCYGVETEEHATAVGIAIGDLPLDLAA